MSGRIFGFVNYARRQILLLTSVENLLTIQLEAQGSKSLLTVVEIFFLQWYLSFEIDRRNTLSFVHHARLEPKPADHWQGSSPR